ncbi:hypothetical protein ACH4E7_45235 [Kitasatospora sp. NPDC018058]|uniref:hypothetical protein n=1 Tax=Kitasatospora sp. NPDC018058 TaxID=3364025 RepID=UPI0037BFDAD6
MRQDVTQDFGQMPDPALPYWLFVGPAKAAIKDLSDHIDRVTTNMLEHAAGNLSTMASSYETADTTAASSLGTPGGQG